MIESLGDVIVGRSINELEEINKGLKSAFINRENSSLDSYSPVLISNDFLQGKKVLTTLEAELLNCDEFFLSVAFITEGGITPLLETFQQLEEKGIPGKILTSDYLCFTQPKAIDKLASLKNIEVRIYHSEKGEEGFHTKGYIFKKNETLRFMIGSSNMTQYAITRNKEWNTRLISHENGELAQEVLQEFYSLWNHKNTQSYEDRIEQYRKSYLELKSIRKDVEKMRTYYIDVNNGQIVPNKMQEAFLKNLMELRQQDVDRALLLSSTGTGKSYASAFAAKEFNPKRLLFVVHREQIAKQALKSFQKIFDQEDPNAFGLVSGNSRELDKKFIFATMQMMCKKEIYEQFEKDEFDMIILDECHHAGANSYQTIMAYFKPKFYLGMTATPDTNQYDIYSIFDHQIAYEIRLQQALEEDLLCPFHYFGITDVEIDGEVLSSRKDLRKFSDLVSKKRVDYILEKAEYYGYSGDRVKGLIFTSSKEEAIELSKMMNKQKKKDGTYYRTAALTGENSQFERDHTCMRLVSDDIEDPLDYILTINIFNEGVDLPEVNQVIMLRPTESSVVFIQQLGRGLRKSPDKEFVVILDFIGNYANNFMIPIALSGDRSYNKDSMRRYIREGNCIIPGCSTIHFDKISKQRIYDSIDRASTNDVKLLKESYQELKFKLGKIPSILDFKEYGSIDIDKYFDKFGSYYAFLKKYEKDYTVCLNKKEEQVISFLSKKVTNYKRIHDVALLKFLLEYEELSFHKYQELMIAHYKIHVAQCLEESIVRNLTNEFTKNAEKKNYSACVFIEKIGTMYRLHPEFKALLENPDVLSMFEELIEYSALKYEDLYSHPYKDTQFQLYQKYTYEDVCRLLGWKQNMNAQNISGYFYEKETKTLPVFINYEKEEGAIAYHDRFVSERTLIALSKQPRRIDSKDAMHIYKKSDEDKDNRIYLFVRKNKNDGEANEFYFLGEIEAFGEPNPVIVEGKNAFEIHYSLCDPVRSDIYDYIVRD